MGSDVLCHIVLILSPSTHWPITDSLECCVSDGITDGFLCSSCQVALQSPRVTMHGFCVLAQLYSLLQASVKWF